ncbi:MAG: MGMT family protein [Desulfobulbaceae bacterium]|nr:MGMT family protein [Desulfobulbaceae bacterium]
MNWEELLVILQNYVPAGQVTTYGNLSLMAFDHRNGAQAIVAMLRSAVSANYENRVWTNRVVRANGEIPDVNGQLSQLQSEGIHIQNRCIDFKRCHPIDLTGHRPPIPKVAASTLTRSTATIPPGVESRSQIDILSIVDDRIREIMAINQPRDRNRIILIIGASQIGKQVIRDIAQECGVDKNDLEFKLDYIRNTFDINRLQNNSTYRCVFVGPNAHKMTGLDGYNNLIARLREDEGFPPYFELRTMAGELRITKESVKKAFSDLGGK